jgi:hypothetical protein
MIGIEYLTSIPPCTAYPNNTQVQDTSHNTMKISYTSPHYSNIMIANRISYQIDVHMDRGPTAIYLWILPESCFSYFQ